MSFIGTITVNKIIIIFNCCIFRNTSNNLGPFIFARGELDSGMEEFLSEFGFKDAIKQVIDDDVVRFHVDNEPNSVPVDFVAGPVLRFFKV